MTKRDMLVHLIDGEVNIPCDTRVRVIKNGSYKYRDLVGKLGTVKYNSPQWNRLGIELDDLRNGRSCLGVFYFKSDEIEIVTNDIMEENDMATNINNITGYKQAIYVKFIGDSNMCGYVYASFEDKLEVGDLVVVKPAHHSINLARVEEILDGTDYETTREVVCKVDTTAYNERVKVRNQAAELKAKMEERARKLQDVALYKMLAENDPEMQDLLNRYQSLPGF